MDSYTNDLLAVNVGTLVFRLVPRFTDLERAGGVEAYSRYGR